MRYLILILILLFNVNTYAAYKGTAAIGAVASNPSNGTVLVSTGSLSSGCASGNGGNYLVHVFVSSTGGGTTFDFQSVFGGVVVSHIYLVVPASSSLAFSPPIDFSVPDAITLQIVNVGAVTGTVQANIFYSVDSCN